MVMTRRLLLIAAVILGAAALALLVFSPRTGSGPDDGTDDSVVIQLLRQPTDVPAFTMTDLDGRQLSSADWSGKVVLVNFWATWCPPCLAEIPDLIQIQEKYRDHVVVVGISEDEGAIDVVRQFAEDKGINYPIVMATPELRQLFPGVIALPTTFALDRQGRLARKHVGFMNIRQTEGTARALAGLSVNARVERVDDPGRLTAESIAQITEIPGVELASLPADKRPQVVQALNAEKCTCNCDLSVAKCRLDDPSCAYSLPIAQSIVQRFAGP
jgi:thiol-disulfide isomerase/thioredoxin